MIDFHPIANIFPLLIKLAELADVIPSQRQDGQP